MQPSQANLMADQLGVNIRWLVLLGLSIYLAWGGVLDTADLPALGALLLAVLV